MTWKGPAAFIAGFLSCLSERVVFKYRNTLEDEVIEAFNIIMTLLHTDLMPDRIILGDTLPRDAKALLSPEFCKAHISKELVTKSKMQGHIVQAISYCKRAELRAAMHTDRPKSYLTDSDSIHFLTITSRSHNFRVFQADQYYRGNRIDPGPFRAWLRYYLNMPQLVPYGKGRVRKGMDYASATCPICGDALDVTGDHAIRCTSTAKYNYKKHYDLIRSVLNVVRRGSEIRIIGGKDEPSTEELLLHQFDAKQVSALFPKTATKAYRDKASHVAASIQRANGFKSETAKMKLLSICHDLLAGHKLNGGALRIDIALRSEASDGETWTDFAGVHPTKASTRPKQLKSLLQELEREMKSHRAGVVPDNTLENTPAVSTTAVKKVDKYSVLTTLGQLQAARNMRKRPPEFHAAVVSHDAEFSAAVYELIGWISKETCRAGKNGTGMMGRQMLTTGGVLKLLSKTDWQLPMPGVLAACYLRRASQFQGRPRPAHAPPFGRMLSRQKPLTR